MLLESSHFVRSHLCSDKRGEFHFALMTPLFKTMPFFISLADIINLINAWKYHKWRDTYASLALVIRMVIIIFHCINFAESFHIRVRCDKRSLNAPWNERVFHLIFVQVMMFKNCSFFVWYAPLKIVKRIITVIH